MLYVRYRDIVCRSTVHVVAWWCGVHVLSQCFLIASSVTSSLFYLQHWPSNKACQQM